MTEKHQPNQQTPDDFDLALIAMQRAANTARKRALQRDGKLVAWRDGHIVREPVSGPIEAKDKDQPEDKHA